MKLRNEQILNVFTGLNSLGNEKFAAKLAWKISTARGALTPFVESLEKTMVEVRAKYAVKDEEGKIVPAVGENGLPIEGTMQVAKENVILLNQELTELLSIETEVENVSLSINDFPDTLEISPNALAALQPILHD
jgi:hypothetical protein